MDAGSKRYMPGEKEYFLRLESRHRRGRLGRLFNYASIAVAGLALIALIANVANQAFGTIGVVNTIDPATLTGGRALDELSKEELADILADQVGATLRVLIRDSISQVEASRFTKVSVAEIVGDPHVDPAIAGELLKDISLQQQAALLADYADRNTLRNLVLEKVVEQQVIASFPLVDAIFNFETVTAQIEGPILASYIQRNNHDDAKVEIVRFHSWLDSDFLTTPMSSTPALGGCAHGADRLAGIDGGGGAGGAAGRCWRRHLPRGIRAAGLHQPADRDQCAQSCRRTFDYLRHAGPGDIRARAGALHQRHDLPLQI